MTKIKVSIVLPVHNGERYLKQCIESLINQTLSDIEIIIVNDGSSDNTEKIISSCAYQDQRIIYLKQEKAGVSKARNKALGLCRGEYVGFIDADDFAEPGMFEELYRQAKLNNADFLIFNSNLLQIELPSKPRLMLKDSIISITDSKVDLVQNLLLFKYDYANWNKLYSLDIIKKNGLHFDEDLLVWEDLLFNLMYLNHTNKIQVINKCLYNYRLHEASVMGNAAYNKIKEFNGLYTGYRDFCIKRSLAGEMVVFKKELSRTFYYALIPKIVAELKDKNKSFFKCVTNLAHYVSQVNEDIINYTHLQLKGVSMIKKVLLGKKWFYLFSLITMFNSLKK